MLEKELYKPKDKTTAILERMEPTITMKLPKNPIRIENALSAYNKIILYSTTGQEFPYVPKIGKFPETQLAQGTHGIN